MNLSPDRFALVPKLPAFSLDLERRLARPGASDLGIRILKVLTCLFVMLLAASAIIALWRAPIVLALALCLLALFKRLLFPIKWEVLWFAIVGYMGAYAEALIIRSGGAWTYAQPQFMSIPIWLPAIWGLTAISLMTAYTAIVGNPSSPSR